MESNPVETLKSLLSDGDIKKAECINFLNQSGFSDKEDALKFKDMFLDSVKTSESAIRYGYENCLGRGIAEDQLVLGMLNNYSTVLGIYVRGIYGILNDVCAEED